jgi:hypothetical protein
MIDELLVKGFGLVEENVVVAFEVVKNGFDAGWLAINIFVLGTAVVT